MSEVIGRPYFCWLLLKKHLGRGARVRQGFMPGTVGPRGRESSHERKNDVPQTQELGFGFRAWVFVDHARCVKSQKGKPVGPHLGTQAKKANSGQIYLLQW
jgi:hypothetical protein